MTNNKLKIGLVASLSLLATASHAQYIRPAYSYPAPPATGGPANFQVGDTPLFATPYIALAVARDDNVFLSRNNAKSSNLVITSPGLKLDARSESSIFQFNYQGQIGRYTSSHEDDYV